MNYKKNRHYSAWAFAGFGFFLVFLTSCKNPSVVIHRESVILDQSWKRRAENFSSRELRVLTWSGAVALLEENNSVLRRANEDRLRARRGISQVYRNLLPYMQLRAGVDKRVNELNEISFDDIRWDLNAYSILSGVLTLGRDVHAAELTYIRSNLMYELTIREKIVELHRLFVLSQQIKGIGQRLVESEKVLQGLPVTKRTLESAPAAVDGLREKFRSQQARLDVELTKLLDLTEFRVELRDDDLPEVDYTRTPLNTTDVDRVGVLRRKLLAVEIVGAQARVKGAKLQYWPDISIFMTSGPLWTTRNGDTIWWRSEDLRLSMGAYVPIDINGRIRNQVSDAKFDLEFLQREISLRESILIAEFEDKHRALVQIERDLIEQERKRSLLMQLISMEGVDNLSDRLRQWSEIESRRENAAEQRAQLNSFFLFFDEVFWNNLSAPTSVAVPTTD